VFRVGPGGRGCILISGVGWGGRGVVGGAGGVGGEGGGGGRDPGLGARALGS